MTTKAFAIHLRQCKEKESSSIYIQYIFDKVMIGQYQGEKRIILYACLVQIPVFLAQHRPERIRKIHIE